MTSDAKLGLLAGVAAVLLIAVVYHRKAQPDDPAVGGPPKAAPATVTPPPSVSVIPTVQSVSALEGSPPPNQIDPLLRRPVE